MYVYRNSNHISQWQSIIKAKCYRVELPNAVKYLGILK